MISDYSTLQQAMADTLARADLTVAIPSFIQLAESDFNRSLRVRQMQAVVTGTATGQTITLPSDLLEVQGLYVAFGGVSVEIHPLPPEALAYQLPVTSGPPQGYVVVGDTAMLIGGQGGLDYTLTYFQSIPSVASAPNWLILREPGLYLYGSLAHSAPYLRNDERIVVWAGLAKAIRDGMQSQDDMARYGNAPSMRPMGRCLP